MYILREDELAHYGVKGMKWGVRRARKKVRRAQKKTFKLYRKADKASYDVEKLFERIIDQEETVRTLGRKLDELEDNDLHRLRINGKQFTKPTLEELKQYRVEYKNELRKAWFGEYVD